MQRKYLWMIVVGVTAVVLGVAAGAFIMLRTKGSPAQTAQAFLAAWSRGDLVAMRVATASAPGDFAKDYQSLHGDIGVTKVQASLGRVTKSGDNAVAPFTAALKLPMGTWKYEGRLRLATSDQKWKVVWTPEAIHPDLHAGQHFKTTYQWPKRAGIVAADGTPIDGLGALTSVRPLVGTVGPATARQAVHIGTPYKKGDLTGQSGIQQRFDKRLAGTPAASLSVADASNRVVKTVGSFPGKPGREVRTSLDLRMERAAANALQGQSKPTSFVAMRPATGQILAVANVPGGFDRAMQGTYPPGSTFKVVTAYALLRSGLSPDAKVECPKVADVGGQKIHNAKGEHVGSMTFKEALAQSCNTAFALQTQKLLSPSKLVSAANLFGFNQKIDPGVRTNAGSFPAPRGDAEMAVAGFGQGRDLANALTMAGVAAGVASGTWRPPALVIDPRVSQKAKAGRLDPASASRLTDMMRQVVISGTAKPAGLPPGTAGKTGTAEFGGGKKLRSHSWFMGFRGDVAFAVIVEGGGFGAKVAAPIATRFLKAL